VEGETRLGKGRRQKGAWRWEAEGIKKRVPLRRPRLKRGEGRREFAEGGGVGRAGEVGMEGERSGGGRPSFPEGTRLDGKEKKEK